MQWTEVTKDEKTVFHCAVLNGYMNFWLSKDRQSYSVQFRIPEMNRPEIERTCFLKSIPDIPEEEKIPYIQKCCEDFVISNLTREQMKFQAITNLLTEALEDLEQMQIQRTFENRTIDYAWEDTVELSH